MVFGLSLKHLPDLLHPHGWDAPNHSMSHQEAEAVMHWVVGSLFALMFFGALATAYNLYYQDWEWEEDEDNKEKTD